MTFTKDILLRPLNGVWIIITGAASLVGILGLPESVSTAERVLGVLVCSFGAGIILLLFQTYQLHQRSRAPVRIRSVVGGRHHYKGTIVLVLDKSNWIEPGQVLVLSQLADGVQTPVALVRVETFTTERFPQCVVLSPLTDEDLPEYLADSSRWKSMIALPEIKFSYLQGVHNV